MPSSPQTISERLERLKADIIEQGRRVQAMTEAAFDAVFAADTSAAQRAIALDDEVDRIDVAIEKEAVDLLTTACQEGAGMTPRQVRSVLTIVKVNNELERIADVGSAIAEQVVALGTASSFPPTFRVLSNSVIGILRDSVSSLDRGNAELAKVVLMSEAAVGEFKKALGRDVHQQLAKGTMSIDLASALQDIAGSCVVMADHCTNIAEQVIYSATGTIVRHMEGRWEEVHLPRPT